MTRSRLRRAIDWFGERVRDRRETRKSGMQLNGLDRWLMKDIGVPDEWIRMEMKRRRDPVRDDNW